jgi:alkylhydroperoxidase family enzyme
MPNTPSDYSSQTRVPLPNYRDLGLKRSLMLKLGTDLNVSRMFAGTDDMFDGVVGLIRSIFEAKGIDPKNRELIILRCAKLLNAPYEWQANTKMAINVGLTQAEIDAAAADGPVVGLSEEQELLCAATDELSLGATLTDATLEKLLARFGDTITRKLILTISWFNMLSRFLNGCRVPLETVDKIGNRTKPI